MNTSQSIEISSPTVSGLSVLRFSGRITEVGLGCVFLAAGFGKIVGWRDFIEHLRGLDVLADWVIGGVFLFLPGLELSVGVHLVVGLRRLPAMLLAALLLAGFLAFAIWAKIWGATGDCSCFGGISFFSELTSWTLSIRNGVILGVALFALFALIKNSKPT